MRKITCFFYKHLKIYFEADIRYPAKLFAGYPANSVSDATLISIEQNK